MQQLIQGDCLEELRKLPDNSVDSLVTDPPAGISFMGKEWDSAKGGRDQWIDWLTEIARECNRVMKPGAHGLVWALPRTSHWTATALENAGFEVRDVVTHLFGSGFPKSHDVSKAIDRKLGTFKDREVIGTWKPTGTAKPRENGSGHGCAVTTAAVENYRRVKSVELPITAPAAPAAQAWQGWGTALKPASEHWILIRKPLSEKTVASNVLKWGTGAINIDESRIGTENVQCAKRGNGGTTFHGQPEKARLSGSTCGRFPANLTLDETAAEMLDGQSATTPSRFFYVAKASKKDKGDGNTHPTVKSTTLMSYLIKLVTPPGGTVLDPFMGSGSTGVAATDQSFNFIGIEREPQYFDIATRRIKVSQDQN